MRNFDDMMCNSISKSNLLAFLFEVWSEGSEILHHETCVFLHTAVAIKNGSERVVICASDTDIVAMALFHFKQL